MRRKERNEVFGMKRALAAIILSAACLCAASAMTVPAAAETKQTGWQTENGKRFYYDADGKKVTGTVEIDGILYLFAPNGAQQLGWQTVDGKRYFYDKKGKAVFGWIEWRGETYYVTREEGKMTGRVSTTDGDILNFDSYGVCEKWQLTAEGSWCYADASGETMIGNQPYLFDENSLLKTGWQTASDGITRYYDAKTHEILTGWFDTSDGKRFYSDAETGQLTGFITDADGKRYYLDSEKGLLTGWNVIEGKQYKLLDNGEVFTGMYTVSGKTYLFGSDGVLVTGFADTADGKRYFGTNGVMLTGLCVIGNDTYYFNPEGIMQTGFQDVPSADGSVLRCFFDSEGKRQTGWITVGDKKYYLNPDGTIAVTPTKIDGKTYLFDANGNVVTGWYTAEDGSKSYAGADGSLVTGWQTIGDAKYYFDEKFIMAKSPTVIGGKTYLFNSDGHAVTGWYVGANGKKYYGGADGAALIGWQELPNQSSYFGADGVMVVSATVDGYTIDANGSARNNRAIQIDTVINSSAKTVYSVYQNFCSRYSYREIEVARTTDQLLAAGWDKLIDTTISRKGGVCYHLASSLDFTFKRAGFTSRVVYAWHGSHHYWCQVLIDGVWWNYDPTYGMARCHITLEQQNQADINNKRPGYTLRGYVNATYDHKGALVSATYTPI